MTVHQIHVSKVNVLMKLMPYHVPVLVDSRDLIAN